MIADAVVVDAGGRVVVRKGERHARPTASVGKLWLLAEVAERLEDGHLDPAALLRRPSDPPVRDSGLWQHLTTTELPVADAAVLVAAVSDNAATNALLDVVPLDAVASRAQALGAVRSALHDRVRDERGPGDAPSLSTGVVDELAEAARRIHLAASGTEGWGLGPAAARRLEGWLVAGVDTSMVLDPLHLDPLTHATAVDDVVAWSKTGSDPGVRADVGVVGFGGEWWAYSAIAQWSAAEVGGASAAREFMREIGRSLLTLPMSASSSSASEQHR